MHGFVTFAIAMLVAGGVAAQDVWEYSKGGGAKQTKCQDVVAALTKASAESKILCASRKDGGRRCEPVTASTVQQFCADAVPVQPAGFLARLRAIGTDIKEGYSRTAGRGAAEDRCPAGLPEGSLLLPAGDLRITDGALGNLTLSDAQGAAQTVSAAGGGLNAEQLRGRSWMLRGAQGGTAFTCKFTVVGGGDANKLTEQFNQLGQTGPAGLLEQALFFRENRLWFEYWRTIAELGR